MDREREEGKKNGLRNNEKKNTSKQWRRQL